MTRSMARTRVRAGVAALALTALLIGPMPAAALAVDADTIAPTTPGGFHVVSRTKGGQLTLGWTASYDAVGVAGYQLYRDGTWLGTITQAGVDRVGPVMFDRITGRSRTPVTYDLYAYDAAGNRSNPAILVVTP